jgi:hypothetical protein
MGRRRTAADDATVQGFAMAMTGSDPTEDVLERRATVRLTRYWSSLRNVGPAPSFRDFDPLRNPVPWENCFLVAHDPTAGDPVFDHIGVALWNEVDHSLPRIEGGRKIPFLLSGIGPDLEEAWNSGQPVEREGSHPVASGGDLLYRSVLLPFVIEKSDRRYVLGATTYRVFAAGSRWGGRVREATLISDTRPSKNLTPNG